MLYLLLAAKNIGTAAITHINLRMDIETIIIILTIKLVTNIIIVIIIAISLPSQGVELPGRRSELILKDLILTQIIIRAHSRRSIENPLSFMVLRLLNTIILRIIIIIVRKTIAVTMSPCSC